MPLAQMLFKASAVDIRRAGVPQETAVTIQHALTMRVDSDFMLDGELIADGELRELRDD